jgi:hypothetical protein
VKIRTPREYEIWDTAKAESEEEIKDLQAQLDSATIEAASLVNSLHSKHYSDVTQWRPLPDLVGMLTQISNQVSGLGRVDDLVEAVNTFDAECGWFMAAVVTESQPEMTKFMASYFQAFSEARATLKAITAQEKT